MSLRKSSLKNYLRIISAALAASLVLGSMNAFSQSDSPLANDRPDTYVAASAAYMVSNMSSISPRRASSTTSTGDAVFRSLGSGNTNIVSFAIIQLR